MTSTFAKAFYRCVKSCGSLHKSTNFARRLECNTAYASRFSISSNPILSVMGNNTGRNLWCLAGNPARNYKSTHSWPTVSCACGSFHSKSDADFSQLLLEEINGEKERMLDIPQPADGWSLKQDGSDCRLTKNVEGDSIEVSFNINSSVPPAEGEDPDEEQDIIAQPDFMVDIKKPSKKDSVSFECYFPDDDGEEHDNIFSIRSVMSHKGDVTEKTYVIDTDNIDPNVYNHMLTYLEERGINNDFADDLINIATAVENQQYIGSLEMLQKFVSCK